MEIDGASIAAIGAAVSPVAYAIGRAIYKDRSDIVEQLKLCEQKHAAEQYRIGSLESALSFLSSTQGADVKAKVDRMLADGNERAEEIKSTVIPTKNGKAKDQADGGQR